MNKIKNIFVFGLSVLMVLFTSCKYGDTNIDPTRPADVGLDLILPTAETQAAFNNMASPARLAGIIMQHFSGFDAQQIDYEQYRIDENTLDNYWNFGAYGGVMKDCSVIIQKGTDAEQPHYVGIAKVLMANALGSVASIFGDAPYSEAFKGQEILKPTFDSQENLYNSVQSLLDEAIVELSKPAVVGGPADSNADLIFGGDADLWIATAHALKARYYMHLIKRDASASTKALAEIGMAFTSSSDQPDFVFDGAAAFSNPLAQFGVQRPNTLVMNTGFVDDYMLARFDPRGYTFSGFDYEFFLGQTVADGGIFWSVNDAPSPLISYTEIKLLEAEAEARSGDLAAANTSLTEAVSSNITYVDAVARIDALGGPGQDWADFYMSTIPDLTSLTQEQAIEAIMIEAYTALYGQAEVEVWTNYRRTGYPVLTPNPNGANGNNPSGIVPRRVPYTQNERVTNQANLDAAIANQGGALLDDDLWAFKN